MESKPENSMISTTKSSLSPPSRKRQKTLSGKDGDKWDDALQQVVIYKNDKSDRGQDEQGASHLSIKPEKLSKPRKRALGKQIGAFASQCAKCQKWILISTKEKYEEIREQALKDPFVYKEACEWKPDVTCDDPSDESPHSGKLWAIDKPNIALDPQGWERLVKI
jgi:hypothetical protein